MSLPCLSFPFANCNNLCSNHDRFALGKQSLEKPGERMAHFQSIYSRSDVIITGISRQTKPSSIGISVLFGGATKLFLWGLAFLVLAASPSFADATSCFYSSSYGTGAAGETVDYSNVFVTDCAAGTTGTPSSSSGTATWNASISAASSILSVSYPAYPTINILGYVSVELQNVVATNPNVTLQASASASPSPLAYVLAESNFNASRAIAEFW